MSFSELRKAAAKAGHYEMDTVDLRDVPPEFELPPDPVLGDRNYVYSVFYDPHRFDEFPERLMREVRDRFPQLPNWQAEPVHIDSLHGRMAAYSQSHTDRFLQFGYVAEIERPIFGSCKAPKRSAASQEAWDAFMVNASFAEAIADAIRKCRDKFKLKLVFRDPIADALAPTVGKVAKKLSKAAKKRAPATTILCKSGKLLVPPRDLLAQPRYSRDAVVAYPAEPVTINTVSKTGRERGLYSRWTSDTRIRIRQRVLKEVRAWYLRPEADSSPEAFLLWALQTVAILRVQATDWKARERPSYVLSEAPLCADEAPARTKARDDEIEFTKILDGLRGKRTDLVPIQIRRVPVTARTDVISMLAGGIGLEDEAIWRDDHVLRDNLARQDLGSLAEWTGRLKRFHRATLSPALARLIEEILTDTPATLQELEMTGDDWSGPRLIRAQFPDNVWRALVDAALYCERGETDVDVRYNWNDDPTRPAVIVPVDGEDNEAKVVIAGPLLDLSAPRRAWWQQQVEQFRKTGSLTI